MRPEVTTTRRPSGHRTTRRSPTRPRWGPRRVRRSCPRTPLSTNRGAERRGRPNRDRAWMCDARRGSSLPKHRDLQRLGRDVVARGQNPVRSASTSAVVSKVASSSPKLPCRSEAGTWSGRTRRLPGDRPRSRPSTTGNGLRPTLRVSTEDRVADRRDGDGLSGNLRRGELHALRRRDADAERALDLGERAEVHAGDVEVHVRADVDHHPGCRPLGTCTEPVRPPWMTQQSSSNGVEPTRSFAVTQ